MIMMSEMHVFGTGNTFFEPECSKEASKFIEENYEEIVRQTLKMGVHFDKVGDIVGDVYISLVNAEENGDGYNFNYYSEGITVEGFVYGRIKQYSKNSKYRNDVVQVMRNGMLYDDIKLEEEKIEEISDSHIRRIKRLELQESMKKHQLGTAVYAASSNGEELDKMDSFQKAMSLAGSYDELGDIEDIVDMQEKIDYCLEFQEQVGVNLITILKNIDVITSDLNSSIFNKLREVVKYHNEFGDALREIIEFSIRRKATFEELISAY